MYVHMFRQVDGGPISLNRTSPVPLYYQLKEIFRSWIAAGDFDQDGRFPSEAELQQRFKVSRMTIRRALSELVQEGFLVREQGRRAFWSGSRAGDRSWLSPEFRINCGS